MKTERIDGIEWPEEIPMPQAGGFHRGSYHDHQTNRLIVKSCLLGWSIRGFAWRGFHKAKRRFSSAMLAAVRRRGFDTVHQFNDNENTADADRMAVWDEAAAEFGYFRTDEDWTP